MMQVHDPRVQLGPACALLSGDAAEELLACAGDLLPVLAGAAGADAYAPVLATQHLPALLTRLRPSQPDGIRGVAVGAIAELSERMQVGQGLDVCQCAGPVPE
jgi:hypothetical protein